MRPSRDLPAIIVATKRNRMSRTRHTFHHHRVQRIMALFTLNRAFMHGTGKTPSEPFTSTKTCTNYIVCIPARHQGLHHPLSRTDQTGTFHLESITDSTEIQYVATHSEPAAPGHQMPSLARLPSAYSGRPCASQMTRYPKDRRNRSTCTIDIRWASTVLVPL